MNTPSRSRRTLRAPVACFVAGVLALAWAPAHALVIGELQGSSHRSPFANQDVATIAGIVTALDGNGFWMQDALGDGNALTSDGIYVFRGAAGTKPLVGDDVRVSGRVLEFRPGNQPNNLTTTQISATAAFGGAFTRVSGGNALPAAAVIGAGFLPPVAIGRNVGNVETAPGYTLQPARSSIDFYEALEGMRVAMPSVVASGPTRLSFGELAVVSAAQIGAPGTLNAPRGGVVVGADRFNGQRLLLDDRLAPVPVVNSGAQLSNVLGVLDYSFSNYKLYVTQTPTVAANALQRETATLPAGAFGLASYNVENLGGNADPQRFVAIATQIRSNLGAPHLLSLQEIQDDNGATNNGVVAADGSLGRLAAELSAQTGRTYRHVSVNPVNNADGGEPGGNIRQAFLYDTARVSFAGVVGGSLDAIGAVAAPGGQVRLTLGAGRIDPTNSAFTNSRKPLVTEFTVDGQQIIVIANHFNSKGGDQPLYGPNQDPVRASEVQRLAQAQAVGSFVAGLLQINPNANVVVTGDLNDFQFADTLQPLSAAGLTNLMNTLPEGERYTYLFDGNLQALDHLFVSPNLLSKAGLAFDIVHANAEFFDQVSDHDPLLLSFGNVPAPVPEPGTLALLLAGLLGVARAARRR